MTDPIAPNDQELRTLDLEIKREELRQLQNNRKFAWINPAVVTALLPILGAAALFIINEIRGYNEAYRALSEVEELRAEADALRSQKADLSQEVVAQLALKDHFSAETKRLEAVLADRQKLADQFYLRAKYATYESSYAIQLARNAGERVSADDIDAALNDVSLSDAARDILNRLGNDYLLFFDMTDVSEEELSALIADLDLLEPSDVARGLEWTPSGAFIPDRKVMASGFGNDRQYYDVGLGRFLTDEEAEGLDP